MEGIARAKPNERAELIRVAAAQLRLHPVNIEKDFWVCWLLKQLFTIPDLEGWLVFKGGTSLSKCFNLIQRFSEDIDLAVDFERLGFTFEKDPRRPDLSRTKRQKLLDEMMEACRAYVAGTFLATLRSRIHGVLGSGGWSLAVSRADPNSVEFAYPVAIDLKLDYIQPHVTLELGTHAEPIPHGLFPIGPFAAEILPEQFLEPRCTVETVVARRTFWEKATILHAEYHRPRSKPMPPRYSRHYVDVAMMARTGVKDEALSDRDLLMSVVTHKDRFYPAAWAKYQEAARGTFRLVPRGERLGELRTDYQAMQAMFFATAPSLDDVLRALARLEEEINA